MKCKKEHPLNETLYTCKCGGPLEIRYELDKIELTKKTLKKRPAGMWKYSELYPVKKRVSLGEGGTKLVKAKRIGESLKLKELYIKEERSNPTGSFKDRGSTVEMSRAIEAKAKRMCVASTGNMGASTSAYAAVSQIPLYVLAPKHISHSVRVQIGVYGSKLIEVEGTYDECSEMAKEISRKHGMYLLGDYAYRKEGQKSMVYEILEEKNFKPPSHIICPIGNGTLLSAIWKGIKEFETLGLINTRPRLIGVQAEKASPVYKAYTEKKEIRPEKPETIAHAIAVGNPTDGISALKAVKESKGRILQISDERMLGAQKLLAKKEGMFVQPAAAAPIAALYDLAEKRTDNIVCIATGDGLKRPEPVHTRASAIVKEAKELDELLEC